MGKIYLAFGAIALVLGLSACGKFSTAPNANTSTLQALASENSMRGAAGEMPAFYDGQIFTVNMMELPDHGSESTIAGNQSINEIYATNDLDEEQDFDPVLDAIQGDGFNPLWRQALIQFTGSAPHQFTSDTEVEAAAAAGEITLVETDEVYRCSVVGQKTATED